MELELMSISSYLLSMAQWMGKVGFELLTWPSMPWHGSSMASGSLPIVVYRLEDSRAGECVVRHLEGYRGILQVDDCTAYHRLARPEGANEGSTPASCWVHVRRKF
jgi:hypothetical protein